MTHLVPVLRPVLGTPFRRGDLYRRAGEVPSFHIAPARTGTARDLITGSVLGIYNSASPAWAVGPDGVLALPAANAPVIEYDPVTLACLGQRDWGVVTNDSKATEAIGGTGWTNQNSISVSLNSTDVIDPAGGNKASKLTWGAANSQTLMPFTAAADVYSAGVWLRTLSGTASVTFTVFLQSAPFTVIGTSTVTVTSTWRRFSFSTSTATAAGYNFGIQLQAAGSVYAFGSQVNRGSQLGPYVQNNSTTLSASSTADAWTITGADFSRIINQTEGTIYIEYGPHDATTPATNNSLFTITTSTTSAANIIEAFAGANVAPVFRVESNSVNQAYITSSNYNPSAIHKLAAAYKLDDFARSIDTQSIGTDTSGALPAVAPSILEIGTRNFGGVKPLNGYIREFAVFRSRRPNANLQAITP